MLMSAPAQAPAGDTGVSVRGTWSAPTALLILVGLFVTTAVRAGAQQAPPAAAPPPAAPAPAPATGRIAGRLIDKDTGRPIQGGRIQIVGRAGVVEADLDGRYRTPPLPVGSYGVRATMIGYRPQLADSVKLEAGKTALVEFAMVAAPVELEEITALSDAPTRSNSDAGLLAIQQAAATMTDGISSQAIARSPDNNAGEAVKRVTGVTLFDGKFLVVRGLGERYSNALLNGAEMPSAVVEKKVPPLDLFPAGLLENVIASKTASPDRPGDFAGGSVELVTKDFPEKRVLQLGISQSFREHVTFSDVPLPRWQGTDFLAIDNGRRDGPANIPYGGTNYDQTVGYGVLQGFKNNLWYPAPREVGPGMGMNFSYGDQFQSESGRALGFIASLTYGNKATFTPNRTFNIYNLGQISTSAVDWGGVLNFSFKPSASTKLGFKNLYSRSGEEKFLFASGTNPSGDPQFVRTYNAQYLERYLIQTQLTGDHGIAGLAVGWKATYGRAHINDPDNHGAKYITSLDVGGGTSVSGKRIIRELSDRTWSGQLDVSLPFGLHRSDDALIKVGVYYRNKHRDYFARDVGIVRRLGAPPTPLDSIVTTVPPEQAFAPENLGTVFDWSPSAEPNDPYTADDRVSAAYGMVDLPITSRLRLVTGLRAERWFLQVYPGADNPLGNTAKGLPPLTRRDLDPLPSANITFSFTDRTQLRLAGSRTVARPDSREISPGRYSPIGGIGTCSEVGDSTLQRTRIINGDVRLEHYPAAGELMAVSAFAKKFDQPIIETRSASIGSSDAECPVQNAESATVRGLEFEFRKGLGFLTSAFRNVGIGVNATVVDSKIQLAAAQGTITRKFVGQSPFVLNAFAAFEPADGPLSLSLLYNYFGDRVKNYGFNTPTTGTGAAVPSANWVEQGRGTLDARMRLRIMTGLRMTLSGQNLTRSPIVVKEDRDQLRIVESYSPGITGSLSMSYDF